MALLPPPAVGITPARMGQVKGPCRRKPYPAWGTPGDFPHCYLANMSPSSLGPAGSVPAGNPRKGTERRGKCSAAEKCHIGSFIPGTKIPQPTAPPKETAYPPPPKCPALSPTLHSRPVHQDSPSGNLLAEEKLTWHSS